MLSWCMDLSNFETLCQRHLPANSARNIRDLCDKIQNKGVGTLPQSGDRTSGRFDFLFYFKHKEIFYVNLPERNIVHQ